MAAEKAAKVKKKKWVAVISPQMFRNEIIGEIPVYEPKTLEGKLLTVNLMVLTRDMKRQNSNIKFTLTSVKGDKVSAEIFGYFLNPTSMRRMVRRGKEKIDLSAVFKTADGKRIRIMPIIIPSTKVKGSVAATYRKQSTNFLADYASRTNFEDIIKDIITTQLQKELKNHLKKVYPVRILEIAKLHIESDKAPVAVSQPIEIAEEEPEEAVEENKEESKATEEQVENPEEEPVEERE